MRDFRLKPLLAALWLLQAAALSFAAAVETSVPAGYAFPRVAVGWASPLPAAFSELSSTGKIPNAELVGGLSKLDLKSAEQRQSLAPVVDALTHDLGLTPEKFIALKPAERASALAMALDEASVRLDQKVQFLTGQAREASWKVQPGDREGQAKLYDTLAALGEIRRFYGTGASAYEPDKARVECEKTFRGTWQQHH